jgi:hypothetical protein
MLRVLRIISPEGFDAIIVTVVGVVLTIEGLSTDRLAPL